jgi:hypothetical protein
MMSFSMPAKGVVGVTSPLHSLTEASCRNTEAVQKRASGKTAPWLVGKTGANVQHVSPGSLDLTIGFFQTIGDPALDHQTAYFIIRTMPNTACIGVMVHVPLFGAFPEPDFCHPSLAKAQSIVISSSVSHHQLTVRRPRLLYSSRFARHYCCCCV